MGIRYIDADELLKHKTDHEMISTHLIYNAPTADVVPKDKYDRLLISATKLAEAVRVYQIADVVEVVRCKDCEFYQDNNDGYPNMNCRWIDDETPDADDYCSYGERREDG